MAENSFHIWDDAIHTAPDQVKRIASAKRLQPLRAALTEKAKREYLKDLEKNLIMSRLNPVLAVILGVESCLANTCTVWPWNWASLAVILQRAQTRT